MRGRTRPSTWPFWAHAPCPSGCTIARRDRFDWRKARQPAVTIPAGAVNEHSLSRASCIKSALIRRQHQVNVIDLAQDTACSMRWFYACCPPQRESIRSTATLNRSSTKTATPCRRLCGRSTTGAQFLARAWRQRRQCNRAMHSLDRPQRTHCGRPPYCPAPGENDPKLPPRVEQWCGRNLS